jgi:hypothetical protein
MKSVKDIDVAALQKELGEFVEQSQHGWFRRNWRWFVPMLLLTIVVVGAGAIYWAIFTRVYNLDVCQSAMQTIETDANLLELLGDPIQPVKRPSREMAPNARVDENEIDILWHIEGPKGHAKAHVRANRRQGKWDITIFDVTPDGGKKITLRDVNSTSDDAPAFKNAAPSATNSETKKSETKAPEMNLDIPVPPSDGPAATK